MTHEANSEIDRDQVITLPTNKSHIAMLQFKQTAYETRLARKHADKPLEVRNNLHESYALTIIRKLLSEGSAEKDSVLNSLKSEQENHFDSEAFDYIWTHVYRYTIDAEYLGNTLKSEIGRLAFNSNS